MNLKDLLQLAGQQGKLVVVGEDGNVKGVFLSFDEFQKLSGMVSEQRVAAKQETIAEKANREILQAQLEEVISSTNGGLAAAEPAMDYVEPLERIDSVLSKRAQELFKSIPYESPHQNFRTPEVASIGDEEISTNFDDI